MKKASHFYVKFYFDRWSAHLWNALHFPLSQHFESYLTVVPYAGQTVYSVDDIEMLWGSRGIFIYCFMPYPTGKSEKAF